MTDVFIESMLCEQTSFLEKIDVEITEAAINLLDKMDPSPLFEAGTGGETKSSGIFDAIIRLLKALINAIGDGFRKIGNWITGAKVTPEGQTARIHGMDPNTVVKLVDGDLADASEVLQRATSGKMTVEEAKAFIDKKEAVWNTLKSSAIPVLGLAGFFLGKKMTVDKWVAEAKNAKDALEQLNYTQGDGTDSKIASKIAHQYGSEAEKAAAKEASMEIVNYMNRTTKRGLGFLMNPIRECVQKGYLTSNLQKEAHMMRTTNGRLELAKQDREKRKATKAETRGIRRINRNLTKASDKGNENIGRQIEADNALDKAKRDTFDNYK